MDDTTFVVLLTMSINLSYQLIHYAVRKFTEYTDIDLACFHFSKNQSSIKNKRSSESDKDGVTEITLK